MARLPGRLGQLVSLAPRTQNFGDLLGPMIASLLLERMGGRSAARTGPSSRLLCVGSILHLARNGDTVWGTGLNGKIDGPYRFAALDVRAVRGPRTRHFLVRRGIEVPEVYGDPALLLPLLHPHLHRWSQDKRHRLAVVPNLNEIDRYADHPDFVNPRDPVESVLRRLGQSEAVVGSSLHAIVVAESLGIPARLIRSRWESPVKYDDYFEGTGRRGVRVADDLHSALADVSDAPVLNWEPSTLLAAFPYDLWDG